jgi:hypothetical protein
MYLLPNGKQVYIETRDGLTKLIDNSKFYEPKVVQDKHQKRLEFGHGANNFLYFRGNPHIYDDFVLNAILTNNFIDVNNVAYNYDVTSDFTWEFRDLVEIKKRKRIVRKYTKPNPKVFFQLASAKKWLRAEKLNLT